MEHFLHILNIGTMCVWWTGLQHPSQCVFFFFLFCIRTCFFFKSGWRGVSCSQRNRPTWLKISHVSAMLNVQDFRTLTCCQLCCYARPGLYTSPHYGSHGPHTAAIHKDLNLHRRTHTHTYTCCVAGSVTRPVCWWFHLQCQAFHKTTSLRCKQSD